jgi:hypothetical protein
MSDTTTINGLLKQKPGKPPQVGEERYFTWQEKTSKSGKPWIHIKNTPHDMGGQLCQIVSCEPTDYRDNYGNESFNVEFERVFRMEQGGGERPPGEAKSQPAAGRDNPPSAPPIDDGVAATRRYAMQYANGILIALEASKYIAEQWNERHGFEIPNEQFASIAAQISKQLADRRTHDGINWFSYVEMLPTTLIKPK